MVLLEEQVSYPAMTFHPLPSPPRHICRQLDVLFTLRSTQSNDSMEICNDRFPRLKFALILLFIGRHLHIK